MGLRRARDGWKRAAGSPVDVYDHGEVTAAAQIKHGGSTSAIVKVKIKNTSGAAITMTAAPTIEPGTFDGQILLLEMQQDSNNTVSVTDEGTTAGTKLRVAATPQLIGNARDTHAFEWKADVAEWWGAYGARVNVL